VVKIITRTGNEEKFDSKNIEKDLEAAGLPERVAEQVAERVEDRVQDRWTFDKVYEQVDLELKRLEEDIQRAHSSYKQRRTTRETSELGESATERTQRFVPESESERHYETRY
jgi:phage shock protein A